MKTFKQFLFEEDSPNTKPWLATTPEEIEASNKLKGTDASKLRSQTEEDEKKTIDIRAKQLLTRDKDRNYVEKDPLNFKVDEIGMTNSFKVRSPSQTLAVHG